MSKKQMSKFAYSLLENYEVYGNTEDEEELGTRDDLINYIAELEAAQRWIPVGERLPEDMQQVLSTDGEEFYIYFYAKWEGEVSSFCDGRSFTVTHWMPLPTPPEVQE